MPGSRADRFDKALAAGASRVVVDLEDAVAPAEKEAARAAVRAWVSPQHPVIVRVNGADTPWFADDLALAAADGVAAILLPKAEQPHVASVMRAGARAVLALVETANAFATLGMLASAPGVARLVFGSIDLQADLGMRDAAEDDLVAFRSALVLASRVAGIAAPIDGVTVALDDEARIARRRASRAPAGLRRQAVHSSAPGADGERGCSRRAPANIAWARRVIAATTAAGGSAGAASTAAWSIGRCVLRAQAILREAGEAG